MTLVLCWWLGLRVVCLVSISGWEVYGYWYIRQQLLIGLASSLASPSSHTRLPPSLVHTFASACLVYRIGAFYESVYPWRVCGAYFQLSSAPGALFLQLLVVELWPSIHHQHFWWGEEVAYVSIAFLWRLAGCSCFQLRYPHPLCIYIHAQS